MFNRIRFFILQWRPNGKQRDGKGHPLRHRNDHCVLLNTHGFAVAGVGSYWGSGLSILCKKQIQIRTEDGSVPVDAGADLSSYSKNPVTEPEPRDRNDWSLILAVCS